MTDWAIVATAGITAAAGLGGAFIGFIAVRQQVGSEERRELWRAGEQRRNERKEVYRTTLNLLSDWLWDSESPGNDYDVVRSFTKPFVHAANDVRIYGSVDAVAAIDQMQAILQRMNEIDDGRTEAMAVLWGELETALGKLFDAARHDVGPTLEDHRR
jgi:hypothetical protein